MLVMLLLGDKRWNKKNCMSLHSNAAGCETGILSVDFRR